MASDRPVLKVIMTGPAKAGKSNLMQRLAHDQFTNEYIPTIGVDFCFVNINGAKLQIWDLSGQAQFQTISSAYLRGSDGVIVVMDVGDADLVKHLQEHITWIRRYSQAPLFVMLNKADDRTPFRPEVFEFLTTFDYKEFTVSAQSGKNVKESFQTITDHLRPKKPIQQIQQQQQDQEPEAKCSLSDTIQRFHEQVSELKQHSKARRDKVDDLENAVHKLAGLEASPPTLNRESAQNAQFNALVHSAMKRIHEACHDVDNFPLGVEITMPQKMVEAFLKVFGGEHEYNVTVSSSPKPNFKSVLIAWY